MTIKDFKFPTQWVRVLEGAYKGQELEVEVIDWGERLVRVIDLKEITWFKFSQVAPLTHVEFGGKRIAIGDEVEDRDREKDIVYGEKWYDGEWELLTVSNNDYEVGCYSIVSKDITAHHPQGKVTLTRQEIAEKFGLDVNNLEIV